LEQDGAGRAGKSMFTPEQRDRLRDGLLQRAAEDPLITGAAITGSAAAGSADRWSDIDLAFGVNDTASLTGVLADWTEYMYTRHAALHHVDVTAGAWMYRVFLLVTTLQVDLAFAPASDFRAVAPTFRLISGQAREPRHMPAPLPDDAIGWGWLYALHARSAIARGMLWQAEYMVSGLRDQALALACIRHGAPAIHGKGFDRLPEEVKSSFEAALIGRLEPGEIARAFHNVSVLFLDEIRASDQALADRLQNAFSEISRVSELSLDRSAPPATKE
jgi:hypothetical protein